MTDRSEVKVRARDVKPYHWGILTRYDHPDYPDGDFVDEIVRVRWDEKGEHLWFGMDTHTTVKVHADEELDLIPTNSHRMQEKYRDWKLPPPPKYLSDASDILAKRALSCRDWAWLPGALPRMPKGSPDFWKQRVGEERTAPKGTLPDFEDDATAGLLLTLVRKVYADPGKLWGGRVEVHQDQRALFFVVQPYHDEKGALQYKCLASGPTEVEALVCALERESNSGESA